MATSLRDRARMPVSKPQPGRDRMAADDPARASDVVLEEAGRRDSGDLEVLQGRRAWLWHFDFQELEGTSRRSKRDNSVKASVDEVLAYWD